MKKSLAFLVVIFVFLTFQPGLYAQEVNLAYRKPVTVSSVNTGKPESNVVDGLENTYWQASDKAMEHWVEIDLGSVQSFNRVKLKGKNYIEYTISYDSGDGVWKEAYSGTCTTLEMSSGLYTIDFAAVKGSKVKLAIKNTSAQNMIVWELQLYYVVSAEAISDRYTINNDEGTIRNIPLAESDVNVFLSNITAPPGGTVKVYSTFVGAGNDQNVEFTEGEIQTGYTLLVSASDPGVTKAYIIQMGSDSTKIFSDYYTVDSESFTITGVEATCTDPEIFVSWFRGEFPCEMMLYDPEGSMPATVVETGCILRVTSESGLRQDYTIEKNTSLMTGASVAVASVNTYAMRILEDNTIIIPSGVSVDAFRRNIIPSLGASYKIYDQTSEEFISGIVGNQFAITVTAEDGVAEKTYQTKVDYALLADCTDDPGHYDDFPPALAVDGDLDPDDKNSRWALRATDGYIQVDLGQLTVIDTVSIRELTGQNRVTGFEIQVSLDGINVETVYTGTTLGDEDVVVRFNPALARYVRLYLEGRLAPAIMNFSVFNEGEDVNSLTSGIGLFQNDAVIDVLEDGELEAVIYHQSSAAPSSSERLFIASYKMLEDGSTTLQSVVSVPMAVSDGALTSTSATITVQSDTDLVKAFYLDIATLQPIKSSAAISR